MILEEDAADPLKLVHGQAAWMPACWPGPASRPCCASTRGRHMWPYAIGAFADALTYLEQYCQQHAEAEAA